MLSETSEGKREGSDATIIMAQRNIRCEEKDGVFQQLFTFVKMILEDIAKCAGI